jgi:ATP-binding cassette subfamily B protein
VLTSSLRLLVMSWRQSRAKMAVAVILMLAQAAVAPMTALGLKWLVNEAVAGRPVQAAIAGIVVGVFVVGGLTFGHFAHIAYFEISDLNVLTLNHELIALANGSAGLEQHERREYADKLTVLEQEIQHFRAALQALLHCAGLGLAMVITGILLAMVNPLLLLLPLAAVPPLVAGRHAERIVDRSKEATAESTRLALNLFRLATTSGSAKELRVLRLGDEVLGRHRALWGGATRRLWRAHRQATLVRAAGQVVFAIGYVGAVLLVIRDAIGGSRTIGDVVLALALAVQVNQQVAQAVSLVQTFQRMAGTYRRLQDIREVVTPADGLAADGRTPERLRHGIELVGVTFEYPGTDVTVLRDVDLLLPAGSTVAIVGENGAGKSTLVKLLCGFYRPTTGRILVDGVDLGSLPPAEWCQRVTAGFQDLARFEFVARQVVGVGDLPRESSEPAVLAALDRSRGVDLVAQLPNGLGTQLGKSYASGIEPSGGQWQKLALGRAHMREQPLLLVLDEPTAALDPVAEHALFERYTAQAARTAAATGGISLFVSHRFSTVRMADLIVVVADGRIIEAGDHATLIGRGGLYADLFGLQAKAYGREPKGETTGSIQE